jgi:nucleotide-binding universal stress UspA family protein
MFKNIIIPTDGTETGVRAVEQGLDIARAVGARITILTVLQQFQTMSFAPDMVAESFDTVSDLDLEEEQHKRTDDRLEAAVRASGVRCTHVVAEHQHLADAVRTTAEAQDCDLIIMPAHERYTLLGRSVDSETARLLAKSKLPVLVLH